MICESLLILSYWILWEFSQSWLYFYFIIEKSCKPYFCTHPVVVSKEPGKYPVFASRFPNFYFSHRGVYIFYCRRSSFQLFFAVSLLSNTSLIFILFKNCLSNDALKSRQFRYVVWIDRWAYWFGFPLDPNLQRSDQIWWLECLESVFSTNCIHLSWNWLLSVSRTFERGVLIMFHIHYSIQKRSFFYNHKKHTFSRYW